MSRELATIFHEHALDNYPGKEEIDRRNQQLVESFPDMVRCDEPCGMSRDGRVITPLIIGRNALTNGRPFLLITAQDHDNEEGTSAGVDTLVQATVRNPEILDSLDYNLLAAYINPDGMATKGTTGRRRQMQFGPLSYMLDFYRAAGYMQTAWGMPLAVDGQKLYDGKDIIPEAQALMALMDRYKDRIDLMHLPHNSGVSDAHQYVSHDDDPAFFDDFTQAVEGQGFTMLDGVPAEMDGTTLIRPGIYYPDAGADEIYRIQRNRAKKDGVPFQWIPRGDHPGSYLQKLVHPRIVRTAATEVPLFGADGLHNPKPSGLTRIQAVQLGYAASSRIFAKAGNYFNNLPVQELIEGDDPTVSRLALSSEWYLSEVQKSDSALLAPLEDNPDGEATIAWASIRQTMPFYTIPLLGMIRRLQEHVDGEESPRVRQSEQDIIGELHLLDNKIYTHPPRNVAVAQALASISLMASGNRMRTR